MRDPVGAHKIKSARSTTHEVKGREHRPGYEVTVIARNVLRALTVYVDPNTSFIRYLRDDVVIEAQRESEGVKAWTEIGRRGWNPNARGSSTESGTAPHDRAHAMCRLIPGPALSPRRARRPRCAWVWVHPRWPTQDPSTHAP